MGAKVASATATGSRTMSTKAGLSIATLVG